MQEEIRSFAYSTARKEMVEEQDASGQEAVVDRPFFLFLKQHVEQNSQADTRSIYIPSSLFLIMGGSLLAHSFSGLHDLFCIKGWILGRGSVRKKQTDKSWWREREQKHKTHLVDEQELVGEHCGQVESLLLDGVAVPNA